MSKKNKQLLLPKLRFPEFRGEQSWKTRKLSDVLTEHKSKSTGVEEVFSVSVHKGLVNQIEHLGRSFAAATTDHYKRVIPGDIVYTKSPTGDFPLGIIKQSKVKIPVIVSPLYGVFTPETYALGCILDAYFASPVNTKNYLSSIVQKGAKNTINVSNDNFLSKELSLPINKNEQQKIADCLTSVDELIITEAQKLGILKSHKKGLMQQLFPAEGETVPKLRFPEFQEVVEWDVEELGDKTDKIGSGITPKGGYKNYKTSGRPFVRSQNVGWGYLILNDVAYIDEDTHATFLTTEIAKGDVLLNITGASIGRSAIANHHIEGGNVNQHVCIIRTKTKKLNPIFLNQFILSNRGQNQIDSFQAGGNRQGLNFAQIRSFLIPIPPNIKEQQKIADCLSSIDGLITAQTQKIDTLKANKKGMMQLLFPSVDEVSA